jgi:hypothetical protein
MNDMLRAAREGFFDSVNLASALTVALAKGATLIVGVVLAFVHPAADNAADKADRSSQA